MIFPQQTTTCARAGVKGYVVTVLRNRIRLLTRPKVAAYCEFMMCLFF